MTTELLDYPSRVSDPASRRLGTFSYLPQMDAGAIRAQLDHAIAKGWTCAIEHVEPERAATASYWYLWKLPMFGERDLDVVMNELTACRTANPGHHVRLLGYDRFRQTQGLSLVVFRAEPAA